MNLARDTIDEFVIHRNSSKALFTAGPAALLAENLTGLRPCFGRDDPDYESVESDVLTRLGKLSGHRHVARMQGAASLALEVAILNFLAGRILVIDTGFYSKRLYQLACSASRREGKIREVDQLSWKSLDRATGKYDWVVSCVTETSAGILLPITDISAVAQRLSARLLLDATASIGLEEGHELADVIAYSSCKGLFGLTGACFIAFNESPANEIDSFYLNLATHLRKAVTGPYHAIASLYEVLPRHSDFAFAVRQSKKRFVTMMEPYLSLPLANQPQLCTFVTCRVSTRDPRAVLYSPRTPLVGSVVCHLGEVSLGRAARGEILDLLEFDL
jgi:aspartate aminotransferase-like enzyme